MASFTFSPELKDLEVGKTPTKGIAWFVAVEEGLRFIGVEKEKGIFAKIKSLLKS
jgi:hypothetical protein